MIDIRKLQQRTKKPAAEDKFSEPVEISVKPPKTRTPTPTPPTPTHVTPITPDAPKEESIKPDTKVYTVWFDDDALGYEVNEIFLLSEECSSFNFRVPS